MPTTQPKPGFVDFRAIKSQVNLQQVLERYQLLETFTQTSDDRLSGPCPIHKGQNPTQFRVSLSKNCFNCFGSCGRGGNVIDFVALMEEIPFRDAALKMQEWFNLEPTKPSGKREKKSNPSQEESDPTVNPPLDFTLKTLNLNHPYLDERGLLPETILNFGLGHCGRGLLRGHIAIPIHNPDGELIAYAGRWPGDPEDAQAKYKFPKGFKKSLELFNLHRALEDSPEGPLVLVEGFFDCFALVQGGVHNSVALMGSSLSEAQEELLRSRLPEGAVIELLFDRDDAGQRVTEECFERLGDNFDVQGITLPEDINQPDQLQPDEVAELFE